MVTEIDSKPNNRNQLITIKPEESTITDNVIPGVEIMDNNIVTQGFLRRTPRKKRNFVNMVKKCYKLCLNTTSTCTPFFIPRTKMVHRNTTRWKKPMRFNHIRPDFNVENGSYLENKNKNQTMKPFLSNRSSTSIFVTDSSDFMFSENKKKHKTINILNSPELPSKEYTSEKSGNTTKSTDKFGVTLNKNINFHELLSTTHNLTTIEKKLDLSNREETDSNYFTIQPFTSTSTEIDFMTQGSLVKESNTNLTHLSKTTNPLNTSASETNNTLKRFYLKKIFHFGTTLPIESFGSNKITQTFELTKDLATHNATVETLKNSETTINETTGQVLPTNYTSISFVPKNTTQFKKIFHIYQKFKIFSSNVSSEKYEEFNSTESTLKQTTDDLETQIHSSSSQDTNTTEENQGKDYLSATASSTGTSENVRKYNHLRNMLHRERRTTLSKTSESNELEGNSTLKRNISDANSMSEPSFIGIKTQSEQESKNDTHSQENRNFTIDILNFKQQKMEESNNIHYTMNESRGFKEVSVPDQNYKETTIGLRDKSYAYSNNTQELSEKPTTHNPFKIKYLIRFKSPVSATQSNFNESSSNNMTNTRPTYTRNTGEEENHPPGKNHVHIVGITTESMNTQRNLSGDFKVPNQSDYKPIKSDDRCYIMTTKGVHFGKVCSIIDQNHSDSEQLERDANENKTQQYEEPKKPLKSKNMIGYRQYKLHGKNTNHLRVNPGRLPHKKYENHQSSTKEFFKEKFDVNVYTESNHNFRHWVFGNTRKPPKSKSLKVEERNKFKWCMEPRLNQSITESIQFKNYTMNDTLEIPTTRKQKYLSTFSSFLPDRKLKNFFHFKTSQIPLPKYNTVLPIPDSVLTMTTYDKDLETHHNNLYSERYLHRSKTTPTLILINNSTKITRQAEIVTLQTDLDYTDITESNKSIKINGHEKKKHFFDQFHTTKMCSLNSTHNLEKSNKQFSKNENGTVTLNSHYIYDNETKVEIRKRHFNKTILHNATDVNDTSFNIMTYVMKPIDTVVGVFRPHSSDNVIKDGGLSATDIKNESLPNNVQPRIPGVFIGYNNINANSSEKHESKLGMAREFFGGLYNCMVNHFVEANSKDIHFYLFTRGNPEEPEELILPTELQDENATTTSDLPEPVFEKEIITEVPLSKREIEDYKDEDDDEEYEFERINPAKSEIQSKWFNIRSETKIIVHGYLEDNKTELIINMREAYLFRGPYNVIVMDWSVMVNGNSCYPKVATRALRHMGTILARFLNQLIDAGVSPSMIHIVGFSLGAHVAGHAGSFFHHGLISRITGLDPALPYINMEPNLSLDSTDAVFVDIIHTSVGLLGQSGPMGHVDFYPNGGAQQPGCEIADVYCSHRRAVLYFIESINSDKGFKAIKCESWLHFQSDNCSHSTVLMGEPCPTDSSGMYYLTTAYKSPYALLAEDHVKVKKSLLLNLFYDFEHL